MNYGYVVTYASILPSGQYSDFSKYFHCLTPLAHSFVFMLLTYQLMHSLEQSLS